MKTYIAWLNGQSVARGTLPYVTTIARRIHATELWRESEGHKGTILRITRGPAQVPVRTIILSEPEVDA